jgi:hypothetical protein
MTEEPQKSTDEMIEEMQTAQQPITNQAVKEEFSTQSSGSGTSSAVPIVAIIAGSVLILGCILACAVVAYAFVNNAPW